jgi:hypothetical protein
MDKPSQNRTTSARRAPRLVKPSDFQKFVRAAKEIGVFRVIIDGPPPESVKKTEYERNRMRRPHG